MDEKPFQGTYGFLSPEICERRRYSGRRADLYACTLVLYKIMCGRLPFEIADPGNPQFGLIYLEKWEQFWQQADVEFSDLLKDFFECTLQYEPRRRDKLAEMVEHPWMQLPTPEKQEVIELLESP